METEKVREKRTFSSSKHTVWKKKKSQIIQKEVKHVTWGILLERKAGCN